MVFMFKFGWPGVLISFTSLWSPSWVSIKASVHNYETAADMYLWKNVLFSYDYEWLNATVLQMQFQVQIKTGEPLSKKRTRDKELCQQKTTALNKKWRIHILAMCNSSREKKNAKIVQVIENASHICMSSPRPLFMHNQRDAFKFQAKQRILQKQASLIFYKQLQWLNKELPYFCNLCSSILSFKVF